MLNKNKENYFNSLVKILKIQLIDDKNHNEYCAVEILNFGAFCIEAIFNNSLSNFLDHTVEVISLNQ